MAETERDWVALIRESVIGDKYPIATPFGSKPLVYADYTASGRALTFIEDAIRQQVLPFYANTHTESTLTGAYSTRLREDARNTIRRCTQAGSNDAVIFTGSGATSAINKFIDLLGLRLPRDDAADANSSSARPVVFISAYEHHSNELPWRESVADVVTVPLSQEGTLDLCALESLLSLYRQRPLLIGSFSAASNVTGIRTDIVRVSRLLKSFGALACWDFAAAGPYIPIKMNGDVDLDAAFLSPHKFIGGPGTPGILIIKRALITHAVPVATGGGTVSWVNAEGHHYVTDVERREEGGTPAIIESIRAGLVFALKDQVTSARIAALEHSFIRRALLRLEQSDNLEVLGPHNADRLAIVSMRFKYQGLDLHYGFVVALLNDLFGIQARGGCSCAGPYGHLLLGITGEQSKALAAAVVQGAAVLRPGWVRLGFNYFIDESEFDYVLSAIELVALHGWRLLPCYRYDADSGVWRANLSSSVKSLTSGAHTRLPHIDALLSGGPSDAHDSYREPWCFAELLRQAEQVMLTQDGLAATADDPVDARWAELCWFARPSTATVAAYRA